MADDKPQDDEPTMTVAFTQPYCRPGTPEAHRHGCLCGFESNLNASMLTPDDPEMVYVVFHKDCPMHQIIEGPPDTSLDAKP